MSKWRITIEGEGPCLGDHRNSADVGGKMLVSELRRRGHDITRAEFAGQGRPPADIASGFEELVQPEIEDEPTADDSNDDE